MSLTACILGSVSGGEIVGDSELAASTGELADGGDEAEDDAGASSGNAGASSGNAGSSSGSAESGSDGVPDCMAGEECSCAPAGSGVCGDGIIQGPEECDGAVDCDSCVAFYEGAGAQLAEATAAFHDGDDTSYYVRPSDDGGLDLVRLGTFFEDDWTVAIEDTVAASADGSVDAAGNVYLTGADGASGPVVASWDSTGVLRWSAVPTDAVSVDSAVPIGDRVVVAGERDPASSSDAILWIFDSAGTELATVALETAQATRAPAELGGDVVTLVGTDRIARFDIDGVQLLWEVGQFGVSFEALATGAADEIWVAGTSMEGTPFVSHYDGSGSIVETIDCVGASDAIPRAIEVSPVGRVAVGLMLPTDSGGHQAYFAVLDAGALTAARAGGTAVDDDAILSIRWRTDGSIGLDWLDLQGASPLTISELIDM